MACLFVLPAPFLDRFHRGLMLRPAFLQGVFAPSAMDAAALRCEACSRRGVRPIRKRTSRLCAACSRRARSPHPQTDATVCAACSRRGVHPIRGRTLRLCAALPPQGKHFLGRCSARRGDADDVVHKIERLQRALDRGGAAHDVGEHDGAILQLDGADIFHDRFLLIAGNADNR